MRDEPARIDRVAGESAADLIIDSAARHFAEGIHDHLERLVGAGPLPVAKQEIEHHRRREFRSRAEPSILRVVALRERSIDGLEHLPSKAAARFCLGEIALVDLPELLRALGYAFASLSVGVGHRLKNRPERWQAVPVVGREIRPTVERASVGHEEHRHRPAALAGHRLHGLHVDAIDVGPLFAIDFDVDEVVVHESRGLFVLERLVRHDVAPVAGGVADAQQDRLVFALRSLKSLGSPRVPVDGVVRVLEEVGARFVGEAVGHASNEAIADQSG